MKNITAEVVRKEGEDTSTKTREGRREREGVEGIIRRHK